MLQKNIPQNQTYQNDQDAFKKGKMIYKQKKIFQSQKNPKDSCEKISNRTKDSTKNKTNEEFDNSNINEYQRQIKQIKNKAKFSINHYNNKDVIFNDTDKDNPNYTNLLCSSEQNESIQYYDHSSDEEDMEGSNDTNENTYKLKYRNLTGNRQFKNNNNNNKSKLSAYIIKENNSKCNGRTNSIDTLDYNNIKVFNNTCRYGVNINNINSKYDVNNNISNLSKPREETFRNENKVIFNDAANNNKIIYYNYQNSNYHFLNNNDEETNSNGDVYRNYYNALNDGYLKPKINYVNPKGINSNKNIKNNSSYSNINNNNVYNYNNLTRNYINNSLINNYNNLIETPNQLQYNQNNSSNLIPNLKKNNNNNGLNYMNLNFYDNKFLNENIVNKNNSNHYKYKLNRSVGHINNNDQNNNNNNKVPINSPMRFVYKSNYFNNNVLSPPYINNINNNNNNINNKYKKINNSFIKEINIIQNFIRNELSNKLKKIICIQSFIRMFLIKRKVEDSILQKYKLLNFFGIISENFINKILLNYKKEFINLLKDHTSNIKEINKKIIFPKNLCNNDFENINNNKRINNNEINTKFRSKRSLVNIYNENEFEITKENNIKILNNKKKNNKENNENSKIKLKKIKENSIFIKNTYENEKLKQTKNKKKYKIIKENNLNISSSCSKKKYTNLLEVKKENDIFIKTKNKIYSKQSSSGHINRNKNEFKIKRTNSISIDSSVKNKLTKHNHKNEIVKINEVKLTIDKINIEEKIKNVNQLLKINQENNISMTNNNNNSNSNSNNNSKTNTYKNSKKNKLKVQKETNFSIIESSKLSNNSFAKKNKKLKKTNETNFAIINNNKIHREFSGIKNKKNISFSYIHNNNNDKKQENNKKFKKCNEITINIEYKNKKTKYKVCKNNEVNFINNTTQNTNSINRRKSFNNKTSIKINNENININPIKPKKNKLTVKNNNTFSIISNKKSSFSNIKISNYRNNKELKKNNITIPPLYNNSFNNLEICNKINNINLINSIGIPASVVNFEDYKLNKNKVSSNGLKLGDSKQNTKRYNDNLNNIDNNSINRGETISFTFENNNDSFNTKDDKFSFIDFNNNVMGIYNKNRLSNNLCVSDFNSNSNMKKTNLIKSLLPTTLQKIIKNHYLKYAFDIFVYHYIDLKDNNNNNNNTKLKSKSKKNDGIFFDKDQVTKLKCQKLKRITNNNNRKNIKKYFYRWLIISKIKENNNNNNYNNYDNYNDFNISPKKRTNQSPIKTSNNIINSPDFLTKEDDNDNYITKNKINSDIAFQKNKISYDLINLSPIREIKEETAISPIRMKLFDSENNKNLNLLKKIVLNKDLIENNILIPYINKWKNSLLKLPNKNNKNKKTHKKKRLSLYLKNKDPDSYNKVKELLTPLIKEIIPNKTLRKYFKKWNKKTNKKSTRNKKRKNKLLVSSESNNKDSLLNRTERSVSRIKIRKAHNKSIRSNSSMSNKSEDVPTKKYKQMKIIKKIIHTKGPSSDILDIVASNPNSFINSSNNSTNINFNGNNLKFGWIKLNYMFNKIHLIFYWNKWKIAIWSKNESAKKIIKILAIKYSFKMIDDFPNDLIDEDCLGFYLHKWALINYVNNKFCRKKKVFK